MKNRLVYVELKSGYGDSGPAWIGIAGASKTGTTIYFNGQAFKRIRRGGFPAKQRPKHADLEHFSAD